MKIIDLTHFLNHETAVYPGTLAPEFKPASSFEKHGYRETILKMLSHTGTHIDAPSHVIRNGRTLDKFPPEKFLGRAIVIPCGNVKEIGLSLLSAYENRIGSVDFILFFTGWQFRWPGEDYFENCPIPDRESAEWLSRFNLKGIGMDAFSIDRIGSADFVTEADLPNHNIFLGREILLIENLTNLDKLPDGEFTFQCFPLKLENADGSPIRATATI